MFNITSAIIKLLNLKSVFVGLPTNNANMYLINFVEIFTSYNISWIDQEALRLMLFPFTLIGEATLWIGVLTSRSIAIWNKF